jgi:hypothetical protein
MTTESDKLIYQTSNTYRIHADNLRWSLLGGYAVFLTAIVGFSSPSSTIIIINQPSTTFLAFLLSFVYLWVLAVQNWFYNLFARWVDDCEYRLIKGISLRSLQAFAKSVGPTVSPFHPAFFLAELLVGYIAYFFLELTIKNLHIPCLTPFILTWPSWLSNLLWVIGFILYFTIPNVFFLKWNNLVYKPIICRLSNIYKPIENLEKTEKSSDSESAL